MISGPEIERMAACGELGFDPAPAVVNPNSVNMTLARTLVMYAKHHLVHRALDDWYAVVRDSTGWPKCPPVFMAEPLDSAKEEATVEWAMDPLKGQVLWPNLLYLGCTAESIDSGKLIPTEATRSGLARLGLSTNRSAGFGDAGFRGCFTLEITVVQPLVVYPGVQICQIAFSPAVGEVRLYEGAYSGSNKPRASRTWREVAAMLEALRNKTAQQELTPGGKAL